MPAFDGIRLQLFARRGGRNYMMRSEKRVSYNRTSPQRKSGRPGGPGKPRKRRTNNGYMLLTLLVSVLLWPVGLFLIWNRRLRCGAGGKALWTAVTLVLFVALCFGILTVPTGNPKMQAFQDDANDFLATLRTDAVVLWDTFSDRSGSALDNMRAFSDATNGYLLPKVADGIDSGILIAADARSGAVKLFDHIGETVHEALTPSAKPTVSVDPTPVASTSPSPDTTPTASAAPTASPTPVPLATVRIATGVSPAATPSAAATPTTRATASLGAATPTATPSAAPTATQQAADNGQAVEVAKMGLALSRSALTVEPEETEAPTPDPTEVATEIPTPKPTEVPTKAPTATPTVAATGTPTATPKPTEVVTKAPTAPPTEVPTEVPTPVPTEVPTPKATEAPTPEPTEVATEVPTEAPTLPPTPIPAQQGNAAANATLAISPDSTSGPTSLKPAGEFMVYHTKSGGWYHTVENCSGMRGATLYTLESSVADGFKPCRKCSAPAPALLEEANVMWLDAEHTFHMSDGCASFVGKPSLMTLSDALAANHTPCADCGAQAHARLIAAGGIAPAPATR